MRDPCLPLAQTQETPWTLLEGKAAAVRTVLESNLLPSASGCTLQNKDLPWWPLSPAWERKGKWHFFMPLVKKKTPKHRTKQKIQKNTKQGFKIFFCRHQTCSQSWTTASIQSTNTTKLALSPCPNGVRRACKEPSFISGQTTTDIKVSNAKTICSLTLRLVVTNTWSFFYSAAINISSACGAYVVYSKTTPLE